MSILRKYSYILAATVVIILGSILAWEHYENITVSALEKPVAAQFIVDQPPVEQDKTLNGVPILMYHKINPDHKTGGLGLRVMPADFDWEMQHLKDNGYHSVNLGAVVDHFQKGTKLPDKPIVITFDDGYQDNYRYAYPILNKYGLTATIFVVTNTVGGNNDFDYKHHIQPKNKMLTWNEIKEMNANGITIGSHTLDHIHLTKISQAEARRQISDSKIILKKELGKDILYFCYPYGDYNQAVAKMVKESGYLAATTTQLGLVQSPVNPYMLKRIRITGHFDHQRFIEELHKY
jgi:peptidoglycan/xylan/chitin deacetylase (PgdA/CDA1 family)